MSIKDDLKNSANQLIPGQSMTISNHRAGGRYRGMVKYRVMTIERLASQPDLFAIKVANKSEFFASRENLDSIFNLKDFSDTCRSSLSNTGLAMFKQLWVGFVKIFTEMLKIKTSPKIDNSQAYIDSLTDKNMAQLRADVDELIIQGTVDAHRVAVSAEELGIQVRINSLLEGDNTSVISPEQQPNSRSLEVDEAAMPRGRNAQSVADVEARMQRMLTESESESESNEETKKPQTGLGT